MSAAMRAAPVSERLSATPDQRRALRRVWPLVRTHRRAMIVAVAVSATASAATLGGPVLVGFATDAVVERDRGALAQAAASYGVVTVALFGLERARRVTAARAGEAVLYSIRAATAAGVVRRSLGFFDSHPTGELVARSTTDVASLSGFVRNGLPGLVDSVLLAVVTLVVIVAASPILAAVAVVYLPVAFVAMRRFHGASKPAYARFAAAEADTTTAIGETVAARSLLQGLDATSRWQERVASIDRRLLAANAAALRADNRLSILGLHQQLVLAGVVVVGGTLAADGGLSIGAVATVALALRQLFGPLSSLSWLYASAQRARSHLARILELTAFPHPHQTDGAGSTRPVEAFDIELRGVSYRYGPDQPVALSDIDLTITSGERVALVGATGSGKSTLAKVTTGLLAPETGTVRIGGRPVDDWNRAELRRQVVLLPQEGHVVAGTLADNLRLVPGHHTDSDLAAAINRAGLGPWVDGLPDGLATRLNDRGADLSAGERQLVALARAAVADPAVLVLDEATADVDPATEALVTDALERLTTGRTVIVVAHRPATAARCARPITLADGRIVADSHNPHQPMKEHP